MFADATLQETQWSNILALVAGDSTEEHHAQQPRNQQRKERSESMNTLFDLVAPIAIYHGADVTYWERAERAERAVDQLRKLARKGDNSALAEAVVSWGFKETADMLEYKEHGHPDGLPNIVDLYNIMFREICEDELPEAEWSRDRYGAWQLRDSTSELVFAGDGCGEYPWYADEESLRDTLKRHAEQMVPLG